MSRIWHALLRWCDRLEGDDELLSGFLLERRRRNV
jgi:hypothetical protein